MAGFELGPNAGEKIKKIFGPDSVDREIRQAMRICWITLPDDRKTVDELEKQIRRLVDRAIKDLREDADAFGLAGRRIRKADRPRANKSVSETRRTKR